MYEIKKLDIAEYLTWQETDSGVYKVIIDAKAATWIIRSLGGFVYSFVSSSFARLYSSLVHQNQSETRQKRSWLDCCESGYQ